MYDAYSEIFLALHLHVNLMRLLFDLMLQHDLLLLALWVEPDGDSMVTGEQQ